MKIAGLNFFELEELVHPLFIERFGVKAIMFLDPALLRSLTTLRKKFGPITVNNWNWGGNYKFSGLRPPTTSVGAEFSMHKYGKAADCKFRDATPQEVQEFVLAHQQCFPDIRRMEDWNFTKGVNTPWLHFDVANTTSPTIEVFRP